MANKAIRERNIDAYYSVRMVDTWTPIFDLSTPEKVRKYTGTTEADIERIAQPFYDRRVRLTSHFHVEESCIGCGLCAGKCPVQAIEIREKRPIWVKEKCVMCLGCLHRCPRFAIQYGRRTKKYGQSLHPNGSG